MTKTRTAQQIHDELAAIRNAEAHDTRQCRGPDGKVLAAAVAIRQERWERKQKRHALNAELAELEAAKPSVIRPLSSIDADLNTLRAERRDVKSQLDALSAERDEAVLRAQLDAMPEAKRSAFKRLIIGAKGIPSGEAVGTPGL